MIARYIQDATQNLSRTSPPLTSVQAPESESGSPQIMEGARAHNDPGSGSEMRSALEGEADMTIAETVPATTSEVVRLLDPTRATDSKPVKEERERTDSSQLLYDIKITLEHVNKVLVGNQNSLARVGSFAQTMENNSYQSQRNSTLVVDIIPVVFIR